MGDVDLNALQGHILGIDSEKYLDEFLSRSGKVKLPKDKETKRVAIKNGLMQALRIGSLYTEALNKIEICI
jgi:hypothetical protein